MTTTTHKDEGSSRRLEILADVCCEILAHNRASSPPNIKVKPVKFPTRSRRSCISRSHYSTREQQDQTVMIKINTSNSIHHGRYHDHHHLSGEEDDQRQKKEGGQKVTMAGPKSFLFYSLEMLSDVCCNFPDEEPNNKEEQPVLDMVEALKFAPHVFYFPTKARVSRKRKVLIMTNDDHRYLSDHPSKKRRRFDVPRGDEDDQHREIKTEVNKTRMKNISGIKGVMAGPNPAPAMRRELMEMVIRDFDDSTVELVIQKSLFETDLRKDQNRVSMPLKQIKSDDFLTEDEKRTMEKRRQDKHLEGVEVEFISPDLSKTEMMLKKWDLQKSSSYVLSHNWHNVAERSKLKAGDIVQIWFFRSREGKPCIALVNLSREPASSSVGEDDHQKDDSEPRSAVTA